MPFLDYYTGADDRVPQILKERVLREDGNFGTFQRDCRTVCTAGLSAQFPMFLRQEYGDLWGHLVYSLVGSMGSAGSHGKTGLRARGL